MAITVTKAEVKRKCMIPTADTTYDSEIDALISEMQPGIEFTIAEVYLEDTGNAGLQAVLKLGIVEIISGEFIRQLYREAGAAEEVKIGGVTIGARPEHGKALMEQGTARLRPFCRVIEGLSDDAAITSTSAYVDRTFNDDSMRNW